MSISCRKINDEYSEKMSEILRGSPVKTPQYDLVFERATPLLSGFNYFFDGVTAYGFFDNDQLIGFFLTGTHKGWYGGEIVTCMYVMKLVVLKEYHGLKVMFSAINDLFENEKEHRIKYNLVLESNYNAAQINRKLARVCRSTPKVSKSFAFISRTLFVGLPIFIKPRATAVRGSAQDRAAIIAFFRKQYGDQLCAPVIDDEWFSNLMQLPGVSYDNFLMIKNEGSIIACCFAWEGSQLIQTRVVRYSAAFNAVRLLLSLLLRLCKSANLPRQGAVFKAAHITYAAVKDQDPVLFRDLLKALYSDVKRKKFNQIIWGSYESDPLHKAFKMFPVYSLRSTITTCDTQSAEVKESSNRFFMNIDYL